MTLRAGDGLNLNFDGSQIEISLARPDWFVAKITGSTSGISPIKHSWVKQQLKLDGTYEDSNPKIEGTTDNCPAYLPSGGTQVEGLVYMRQRGVGGSGQTEYEIISSGSVATGNNAVIEVVTDVQCTPEGLQLSTISLSGANYDNAVIRQFLALSDVTPKSYLAQQGRAVVVNAEATGLEFGPVIVDKATTFISLTDTPEDYKGTAYFAVSVSSGENGVTFSVPNVTTKQSLAGGGNPISPYWQPLSLVGDVNTPSADQYYGTNSKSVRGWHDLPDSGNSAASITGNGANATPFKLVNDADSPGFNKMYGTDPGGGRGWLDAVTFSYVDNADDALDGRIKIIENAPYATEGYVDNAISTEANTRFESDTALDGRVTALEASVLTLQGDLSLLQGDLVTLQGTVSGHTSSIASLTSSLGLVQGDVAILQGQMGAVEGDIFALNSGLSTETNNRISADSALDGRLTTAEGTLVSHAGTLGSHASSISTLQFDLSTEATNRTSADSALDTRVSILEGQTLDARLSTLEGQNLDTRLTTLEGQNLDARVTDLESYITSSAVTLGGTQVVGTQQAAVADAAGGTIDDTSLADCASSTQAAVDDLKTQLNAALAALRAHGLIAT